MSGQEWRRRVPLSARCSSGRGNVAKSRRREFGVRGRRPDERMSGNESDVLARLQRALESAGVAFVHTRHEAVYTSAEAAAVRGERVLVEWSGR